MGRMRAVRSPKRAPLWRPSTDYASFPHGQRAAPQRVRDVQKGKKKSSEKPWRARTRAQDGAAYEAM